MTGSVMHPDVLLETQLWLQRARVNAKSARILVEQKDASLKVETVSQVQQACEKATKAVMFAQGMPYKQVKEMSHNTIGAFVNLMAEMLDTIPQSKEVSRALLKPDATESASILTKAVFAGQHKRHRKRVLYALKQVLPDSTRDLGNKALDADQWKRLTRAFLPQVVEIFIEFHEYFKDMWRQYINGITNEDVDPRPLLAKEVNPETWVFNPSYAGLARRFPGQESDAPINPILASIAQQILNDCIEQLSRHRDRKHWPKAINIRELLIHISNWLTSLGWLFLCGTVTTPHANSSRYPVETSSSSNEMGFQHYNDRMGVVACIGPLAVHTDDTVDKLVRQYRQIEEGYPSMWR